MKCGLSMPTTYGVGRAKPAWGFEGNSPSWSHDETAASRALLNEPLLQCYNATIPFFYTRHDECLTFPKPARLGVEDGALSSSFNFDPRRASCPSERLCILQRQRSWAQKGYDCTDAASGTALPHPFLSLFLPPSCPPLLPSFSSRHWPGHT